MALNTRNIRPIVLDRRAQNTAIAREIVLGEGGHDAAAAGPGDVQPNLVSDGQGVTDSRILTSSSP